MKAASIFLALLLVFTFALHTIHFDHDHPEFFGEGQAAMLHGENKKWFTTLPAVFGFSFTIPFLICASILPALFSLSSRRDPIRLALSQGKIQSRLYE